MLAFIPAPPTNGLQLGTVVLPPVRAVHRPGRAGRVLAGQPALGPGGRQAGRAGAAGHLGGGRGVPGRPARLRAHPHRRLPRQPAGGVRHLAGRAGPVRRADRRHPHRAVGGPPARPARAPGPGRRHPGHPPGPGLRPLGQLLQPGAVRHPHDPALGAGGRPRAPARPLRRVRHLPPHVPVRVAVQPGRGRRPAAGVGHPAAAPGQPVAAVPGPVRRRPVRAGAAAHRYHLPVAGAVPQRLDLPGPGRGRVGVAVAAGASPAGRRGGRRRPGGDDAEERQWSS